MELRGRYAVDDAALTALHALAFGNDAPTQPTPWAQRLERHSLTWVGAFDGDDLVGFVHVVWDGGAHGFLLDTVVHPDHRRRGVGRALVSAAIDGATDAGCVWLHVDHEPHLSGFYAACGFRPTAAGLLRLRAGFGTADGE